ncbi:helix-turn-helix transcriptional regulator [Chitinibacteraceae bacterium HSL-7]
MPAQPTALAEFLRALRERSSPELFGFASGRRRTAGLRREEVAQLAGISPTWYAWIEQGRPVSVSAGTLTRLADTFKLARTERALLFELAGRIDPTPPPAAHSEELIAGLAPLVDTITTPAYILDGNWDVLAANAPARQLFAGWLDREQAHNLLDFVLTNPLAAQLVVDLEVRAERLVAEFRADHLHLPADPRRDQLIARLIAESELFRAAWQRHDVMERQGGVRAFRTRKGELPYHQHTFRLVGHDGLKLVMLTETT